MEDDALFSIIHGCQMARELEGYILNFEHQPSLLRSSCEEIAMAFATAANRLISASHDVRDRYFATMDLIGCPTALPEEKIEGMMVGGGGVHGSVELSDSKPAMVSSVLRSCRKRKDFDTRTTRVEAPRLGNLDVPPEDGYTWRKYGQKDILGSGFPRSYYRCTHKNFYGCNAKKQVQRLDHDPFTFEITYCGDHTCHVTATAIPLSAVPSSSSSRTTEIGTTSFQFEDGSWQELRGGRDIRFPVTDFADITFNSGVNDGVNRDIQNLFVKLWKDST